MSCLGFDKARYSLRAENDETKTTTHATRRRGMIVSHLGFLAEHNALAPCASDRKVASAAADRAARDTALATKQATNAANVEARATKQRAKGLGRDLLYRLTNRGRFHTLHTFYNPLSEGDFDSSGGGGGGRNRRGTPAASKNCTMSSPAKAWRCGNSLGVVAADDDEDTSWTVWPKCGADLWFCRNCPCQTVSHSHERMCEQEGEEAWSVSPYET